MIEQFPEQARYEKIMDSVRSFFIKENISSFPIDPFEIIRKNKWGLMTYSEIAEDTGLSIEMVVKGCQSEDGYIIRDNDNYCIAYNDTITTPGRIRFTLMHEIGHIYLNHLVDFNETMLKRSRLTRSKYEILEREAHAFARNSLAPAILTNVIIARNPADVKYSLMSHFGITYSAAKTRLEFLRWDLKWASKYLTFYYSKFNDFLHKLAYGYHCFRCRFSFKSENAKFCPICGNGLLSKTWSDSRVIYDGYELDENGRALTCPRCGNEELDYEGDYCKICGVYLVNKCTNVIYYSNGDIQWECGTIAEGNARYCVNCGHQTSYFQQGLLKPWNEARVTSYKVNNESDNPFKPANEVAASKEEHPFADVDKPIDINNDDLPF